MGKGLEGFFPRHLGVHLEVVHIVMLEHELKEEEGHDPTRSTELCEGKREICGEAHGADLVILEQTEILCMVVTPGDQCTRNNVQTRMSQRTRAQKARGRPWFEGPVKLRQCVSPRK